MVLGDPKGPFIGTAGQVKISAKFGYRFWLILHAKLRMVDNFLPDPARKVYVLNLSGREMKVSEVYL